MKKDKSYTITVLNAQGASEQHTACTKAAINDWLATWSDPEDLTATVKDDAGNQVGSKRLGRKTIAWLASPTVKAQRIAQLRALFAKEAISEANGARAQRDDAVVVRMATCGNCGVSWNDALITGRTPAPSARCPYEHIHAEIGELAALTGRVRYASGQTLETL